MARIELTCPTCEQQLELDEGFAGGVCRCSECGTLMTVPSAPDELTERLRRPERPPMPPGASVPPSEPEGALTADRAAPISAGAAAGSTGPAAADEAARAAPHHDDDAPAAALRDDAADAGANATAGMLDDGSEDDERTLTTESGRTVRLAESATIPIARRKRPVVRIVTAGAVILALMALTALIGYALFAVVAGDATDDPAQVTLDHFGYDPTTNLYELDQLNVLGLALHSPSAVVVDASGSSQAWLTLVQDAIHRGVSGRSSLAQLGMVYAAERGPQVLGDGLQVVEEIDPQRLYAFQDSIAAAGVAPLGPALAEALAWGPRQVIVITGKQMDGDVRASIEQAMGEHGDVRLDLVLVDVRSVEAEALVERFGGRLVQLTQGQLLRWSRAADVAEP